MIRTVEKVGRPVPCVEHARREGDPPVLVAKSDRARQVLGWEPQFGELEEIVRTAWRWHSSR